MSGILARAPGIVSAALFRFLGINDVIFIHAQCIALAPDARSATVAAAESEIERLFGIQQLAADVGVHESYGVSSRTRCK